MKGEETLMEQMYLTKKKKKKVRSHYDTTYLKDKLATLFCYLIDFKP